MISGPFFVENIFEELDNNGEWYFNETNQLLYYWPNNTNASCNIPPSKNIQLIATNLKILFHFNATMNKPIQNINIFNLNFRDAAQTYLDKDRWGVPSGG